MAKLPKLSLVELIDSIIHEDYPRPHLGGSQIGSPCQRSLVYMFNWAYKIGIPAKSYRIFRMGDDIEQRIIEALESVGIEVFDTQVRMTDKTGHAGGSIDGKLRNVPGYEDDTFLFEAKSMNQNNFMDTKNKGVQEGKPQYYSQMQMYMGRLGLSIGLFVAMNKNTSELYTEMIPFDANHFDDLVCREQNIILAQNINEFPKINNNPSWYQCKFCDAKYVCHHEAKVEMNCRTCEHSEIHNEGRWWCPQNAVFLDCEEQKTGCSKYKLDEDMWT